MGWPQKPASPRVDPRGANHGIEGRLERRFSLTSVARRWHGLERVAHRRRVCQHERVHDDCVHGHHVEYGAREYIVRAFVF